MRRADIQHHFGDLASLSHAPLAHPGIQPGQLEQAFPTYLFGDLMDEGGGDWQAPWIDLGGEG